MSEPGLDLSIVVPAHNEAARLAAGYARLAPTLERLGPERVEVVVVDDGSADATAEAAARVYGSLPHHRVVALPENRGKGAALRLGLRVARGPLVVTADADMAIDPGHIPEVMTALERADLAPGSRTGDGRITYDAPWRTIAGAAFSRLVHHYVTTPLRDTQCGFKGYRLGAGRLLALLAHVEGFAIDVELFHLARVLGLSVEPVPVTWSDVPGSSVHPGRVALDVLRDVRGLAATRYVNPAVVTARDVALADVAEAAARTRLVGLVVARGAHDALVVLGRDDAVGGAGVAAALGGELRTTTPAELAGRVLEPT